MNLNKLLIFLLAAVTLQYRTSAQDQIESKEFGGSSINTIQSVVPFLTIAPDSRSGGIGDAGVATSPDFNSMHWNPAKYAFIDGDGGIGLTYSPWLRNLVNDINLAYLTGYYRFDDRQVIAMSLLYFSLGNITFTDPYGNTIRNFNPNEFSIDAAYSRIFGDHLSLGIAFRYIYSNLTGGITVGGGETKPGMSIAADVSTYYENDVELFGFDTKLSWGANISNIGTKMTYTDTEDPDFIPTNFRLGGAMKMDFDQYNSLTLAIDLNKLLVPTPPVYYDINDTLPNGTVAESSETYIKYGKDPNVGVPVGMIQSFYDAPGGFSEEMHEIAYSIGLEYWYNNQFAVRAGYFHEHQSKGNRKFFTAGVGLKLNIFNLDFAYLIPTVQNHPLAKTLRFTIGFDFDSFRKLNKSGS